MTSISSLQSLVIFTFAVLFLLKGIHADEKVSVVLLYESECPYCMDYYTKHSFLRTIQELGNYINLSTIPYGNAKTSTDENGNVVITCQHGETECYGNKLHACAIELLQHDPQLYVPYIACMTPSGSDDAAADQCGQQLQVDANGIKECAKGDQGFQLLKYYGDLTCKYNLRSVPTVLVNNQEIDKDRLKEFVCYNLNLKPEECQQN